MDVSGSFEFISLIIRHRYANLPEQALTSLFLYSLIDSNYFDKLFFAKCLKSASARVIILAVGAMLHANEENAVCLSAVLRGVFPLLSRRMTDALRSSSMPRRHCLKF